MSVEIIAYGNPLEGSKNSIEKANIELLSNITAQAKALTPVDTGFLRGSLMWKVPGTEGGFEQGNKVTVKPEKESGLVGSAMEYAIYVEFGTRYMDAQPYLRPAVMMEAFGAKAEQVMAWRSSEEITKAFRKGKRKL